MFRPHAALPSIVRRNSTSVQREAQCRQLRTKEYVYARCVQKYAHLCVSLSQVYVVLEIGQHHPYIFPRLGFCRFRMRENVDSHTHHVRILRTAARSVHLKNIDVLWTVQWTSGHSPMRRRTRHLKLLKYCKARNNKCGLVFWNSTGAISKFQSPYSPERPTNSNKESSTVRMIEILVLMEPDSEAAEGNKSINVITSTDLSHAHKKSCD